MTIVEFAAWIIVLRAAWGAGTKLKEDKRRRIELNAVKAEYEDSVSSENNVDESQPEWKIQQTRERHRARQQGLLMRYPGLLIPPPAQRYYAQARQEETPDKPFRETLRDNWKGWLFAVVAGLVVYAVGSVLHAITPW